MVDGRQARLHANDHYIYVPGFPVSIVEVSPDYHSYCLMADDQMTLEGSAFHTVFSTINFPVRPDESRLSLSPEQSRRLTETVQNILHRQQQPHLYLRETLRSLYALYLLDLTDFCTSSSAPLPFSERTRDIFLGFMRLAKQHFVEHHDLDFYASRLCITTTYLSRVVRQVTHRTACDHLDQLLLAEASHLLLSTVMPIAEIARYLRFSDQTAFTRFFSRQKGISPKQFRMKR